MSLFLQFVNSRCRVQMFPMWTPDGSYRSKHDEWTSDDDRTMTWINLLWETNCQCLYEIKPKTLNSDLPRYNKTHVSYSHYGWGSAEFLNSYLVFHLVLLDKPSSRFVANLKKLLHLISFGWSHWPRQCCWCQWNFLNVSEVMNCKSSTSQTRWNVFFLWHLIRLWICQKRLYSRPQQPFSQKSAETWLELSVGLRVHQLETEFIFGYFHPSHLQF